MYISTNGIRLHTVIAGPEDGPVVILLHGFPSFWYSWRYQIPVLAEAGYRVVVPDQRGYNLSDKGGPYDMETLLADTVGLIRWSGENPVYLIGHDWGAAVAWTTAARYPDLIRKLVILNVPHPNVMMEALRGGNIRQLFRSWYMFFFQIPGLPEWSLKAGNYRNLKRMMRQSSSAGTFDDQDLERLVEAWGQPGALSASIGWYRALLKNRNQGSEHDPFIYPETLILWGEEDVAIEFSGAQRSLNWTKRGRLISYPNASHWVHEDEPSSVNAELLRFLGESDD